MSDHAFSLPLSLPLDIERIQTLLPHRYPFLLVDRVLEFEAHKRLTAIKNVSINEPCFQGHFPDRPVMPGVLLIEGMAQTAGLLTQLTRAVSPPGTRPPPGKLFYLAKVDNARFLHAVVPGDQVRMEAELVREIRRIAQYRCRALVEDRLVAQATLMCAEQIVE